jgi:hypothetical protein
MKLPAPGRSVIGGRVTSDHQSVIGTIRALY